MKPIEIKFKVLSKNPIYTTSLGNFKTKEAADRFAILEEMLNNGLITDLRRNAVFTLLPAVYKQTTIRQELRTKTKIVKGRKCVKAALTLSVEFTYHNNKGKFIVEVVKSAKEYKDPTYILKNKLVYYLHRINIVEN